MADNEHGEEAKQEEMTADVQDMRLKEEQDEDADMDTIPVAAAVKERSTSSAPSDAAPVKAQRQSASPIKADPESMSPMPAVKGEDTKIGADVELKLEGGERPKLVRKQSQKVRARPRQLFNDYENKIDEATSTFSVLNDCVYANKYLGATDPALECECQEEWGAYHVLVLVSFISANHARLDSATRTNHACGEDSDCINRATKMECCDDCSCGAACQNQRFQRKQFANVAVIKTEKKGYGLRAESDLQAHEFIFEYIGEVIGEGAFRKRMQQYDEEGIKHFYFMSLTKGEFVDATKRGNLGRFCNHSCNPNCYVDKWVVGDKLRMGIFAERKIQVGEELTFNYNVDRYGAEPQPCYCGEPNCTGYIGGKTQTERGTKLSNNLIEALGIDDADAWDTAVAKKPRKKKTGEDDEEYVNNVQPRGLDEDGVNKVMASLMQCKEKWIAVKLLARIQRADDEKVRNRVVRFHGYRVLKTALSTFIEDVNVCLQVLDVLDKMPRLTRNKIQDSKIEETVLQLTTNENERVAAQSKTLLEAWAKLEVGYRIPRMKRDANVISERKAERSDRRDGDRQRARSRSRSKSPERMHAPTGPRSNASQRTAPFRPPPPRYRPPPPGGALPEGWCQATTPNGRVYYYTESSNVVTWQRPTQPAAPAPPPPPPVAVTAEQNLSNLIASIIQQKEPSKAPSETPTPAETPKKERKEEKWRSLPIEKQKKLYEGSIAKEIIHVSGKFKSKIEKDDLKRWSKEFAKRMVESDFEKGRVTHPEKLDEKKIKDIRKRAYEFFEKACKKVEAAQRVRSDKKAAKAKDTESHTPTGTPPATSLSPAVRNGASHGEMSEDDRASATPAESSSSAAAKRPLDEPHDGGNAESLKRQRTDDQVTTVPPPPPPPPPMDEDFSGDMMDTDELDQALGDAYSTPQLSATEQIPQEAQLPNLEDEQAYPGAQDETTRIAHSKLVNGLQQSPEVLQTATPPTTGSPDHEETEKMARQAEFSGMNPERMKQLGLFDGASE